MLDGFIDDKSALVQVMAWCRQDTGVGLMLIKFNDAMGRH